MIRFLLIGALAGTAAAAVAQNAPAPTPAPGPSKTLTNVGFSGSECVRYDDQADEYVVANIGPAAGQGFVSRVSPDGTVKQLKWIEGGKNGAVLERPLGLFIKGNLVYVADTKAVQMFDRKTGAPRGTVAIPEAQRLNDLTVSDDGTVYVTDSGSPGALWVIRGGKPAVFAERNDALESPNGIALLADGTVVHGGKGVNLVYRDRSGKILRERTLPTGQMDGIVPLPDGSLLVASQLGNRVYRVPAIGAPKVVAQDIAVPAAIGWDSKRNRLLVPQIRLAQLDFYELGN